MTQIPIAFIIDTINSPTAGTENQLLCLFNHLNRSRFQPILCCLYQSSWMRTNLNFCRLFEVGTIAPLRPTAWPKLINLARFLGKNKVQVVHAFFRDANIAGVVAAQLAGVPVIISARRNMGFWHTGKELLVLRMLNRWVTRFLANSEAIRGYTHRVEGVPMDKIDVIMNGVDLQRFPNVSPTLRKAARVLLGLPLDTPIITCVANLRQIKRIDLLLRAMQGVLRSFADTLLLLVGDGDEHGRLDSLATSLGVQNNVRFMGVRTDVPEILQASDVGVLCSDSEGLSNSILEYMATGLPVVCTEVGGSKSLIQDGVHGFLVPKGNDKELEKAITRLIGNTNLSLQMGRAARAKVEDKFDLEQVVRTYEQYYLELVHGPKE